jgi:hypothetical protein
MTLLVSDGKCFRSINHYLKKPFSKAALEFAAISEKIEPKLNRLDRDKFFQRVRGQLFIIRKFAPWFFSTVRLSRFKPIRSITQLIVDRLFRKRKRDKAFKSRRARRIIRVAMLPFEEQHSIDAARLKNCKAVFAYEDVEDGKVKFYPACNWYPYRDALLEKISGKYGVARGGSKTEEPAVAAQ